MAETAFGIAAALLLVLSRSFCNRTATDIFFSLTLASTAIVFLHMRSRRELLQLALTTCVLFVCQAWVLRVHWSVWSAAALLGLSSLLLLGLRWIWSRGNERSVPFHAFLLPLLLVLLGYFGSAPMDITNKLHPRTLDLSLLEFDASLGTQLSYSVGRLVFGWPWLTRIALFSYYLLPLALMLVLAQQLRADQKAALTAFLAFFVAGPLGVIFYNMFPACGPIYLVGARFPFAPLAIPQIRGLLIQPVPISGTRNAFPSLHMGWALLACWYSEGLWYGIRWLLMLFLVGTVLATLGLGEHYFIDLVAAFPFALMIFALCALKVPWFDRRRSLPLLAGIVLLVGWIVLLRLWLRIVWISSLIPWALIVGTVVSCMVLQVWLRSALFPNRAMQAERR